MLNGQSYFISALYHIHGGFSYLPSFTGGFAGRLSPLPFERGPVLKEVERILEEYSHINKPIGEEEALKLIVAEDLSAITAILRDDSITRRIDRQQQIDAEMNRCKGQAIDLLRHMDVEVEEPPVFVVDEIPSPYTQRGYSALTADEGDREKYGITPGHYFLRNDVVPFYSEFLLAHELIHSTLGKHSPELLARGLEEGLAEFIGSMYLSSKILGKDLTINLFIYNRLSSSHNQFWELYLDATRQATMLYHRFGLQGVLSLLNAGREAIKEIENYCLRKQFDKIDLPHGEHDPDLTEISDYLALAFGRNLVVSPLAKYLTRYIHPGDAVADILQRAGADEEAGRKAIDELQDRISLIGLSEDSAVVNWSDCELLSSGSVIRYELPATN